MAAQNTHAPANEADDILNRLMNKAIPAAVDLDARMRTLISIASLTAMGEVRVLRKVVADGIQSGVTPVEMREAMMQSMAYSGLPTVLAALDVLAEQLAAAENLAYEAHVPPHFPLVGGKGSVLSLPHVLVQALFSVQGGQHFQHFQLVLSPAVAAQHLEGGLVLRDIGGEPAQIFPVIQPVEKGQHVGLEGAGRGGGAWLPPGRAARRRAL